MCVAIAFLTCDESDNKKMQLVILCRTQGKDIYDYMFREGSNTALSVLDNIGCEAAGLGMFLFTILSLRVLVESQLADNSCIERGGG